LPLGPVIKSTLDRLRHITLLGGKNLFPFPIEEKFHIALTFSLTGEETGGEAGCWSVPLDAIVRLWIG